MTWDVDKGKNKWQNRYHTQMSVTEQYYCSSGAVSPQWWILLTIYLLFNYFPYYNLGSSLLAQYLYDTRPAQRMNVWLCTGENINVVRERKLKMYKILLIKSMWHVVPYRFLVCVVPSETSFVYFVYFLHGCRRQSRRRHGYQRTRGKLPPHYTLSILSRRLPPGYRSMAMTRTQPHPKNG